MLATYINTDIYSIAFWVPLNVVFSIKSGVNTFRTNKFVIKNITRRFIRRFFQA